jgi:ubiquinone/menaquinone biosynthesis C-methylase UbiE
MGEPAHQHPGPHGGSSRGMLDAVRVLDSIGLKKGDIVLDAGAGYGYFSFAAAEVVGEQGKVYAVDAVDDVIAALKTQARNSGISNVVPIRADLGVRIPLDDASVDVCLMANVLHDLIEGGEGESALAEVARVLRPLGTFALVEFKKIPDVMGPPMNVRLAPDEAQSLVTGYGFKARQTLEVGPRHYMILFTKK